MRTTPKLPSRSTRSGRGAGASRTSAFATSVLLTAVLAACGSGGSGDPDADGPEAQTATLKVAGVAAVGAALAGANVTANCATGRGNGTAGNDGAYEVSIAEGALPCVLEAVSGSTTLHSVATGSGAGSATAHITPLTELLVAHLVGQDPKAYFAGLAAGGTALATAVTADAVAGANTAVLATLRDAGLDTEGLGDLVGGQLRANGAGYDGVLDELARTLAQTGAALDTLVTAMAAASPAAIASGSAASTSEAAISGLLPAAALLRPKAADCPSLRSGKYRFLVVKPSASVGATDPLTTTELATLDAAASAGPTWTWEDGSSESMEPAGEPCHYRVAVTGGGYDFLVAPSGIGFARSNQTGSGDSHYRLVIALPEQTMPVATLAGKWNSMGWGPDDSGAFEPDHTIITIGNDGRVSATCNSGTGVDAESACTDVDGPYQGFVANSAGGYDVDFGPTDDPYRLRAFAFQGGNGMKLVVMAHADGGVHFMTPYRSWTAQAVGSTSKVWNLQIDTNGFAGAALAVNGFEVTAVDASAGTLTRTVTNNGVSHSQTLHGNDARDGWMYRAGGSAMGSGGSMVPIREAYLLPSGLGFTTFWLTPAASGSAVGISVTQP
ncbi:MAG: hypothetical protein LT106_04750 [Burkholderiaceae bacterium]|nr:hypothetical protein [Burkholderiaceae bacterium]